MIGTRYTDVKDLLEDDGEITRVTRPAAVIAAFLRSVVGWVTMRQAIVPERTNVTCRRVAAQKRCRGEIHAYLVPKAGEIWYACPGCAAKAIGAIPILERRGTVSPGIH